MTKEYHIDFYDLARGEEYEGDFMGYYTPGQSCAIRVKLPEDLYHEEEWEMIMYEDLIAIGLNPGEHIWIEVDY